MIRWNSQLRQVPQKQRENPNLWILLLFCLYPICEQIIKSQKTRKKVLNSFLCGVYYRHKPRQEDGAMTIKEFINKAMDIATILLNNGDHEGYSKVMAIIADEIYKAQVQL